MHSKRAITDLVGGLDERDRFGLVIFDGQAEVHIPAGLVGDLGRKQLLRSIAAVEPGGNTDLSSGYLRGLQEARRVSAGAGATLVLLSDGQANVGVTDPAALRRVAEKAAKQSITTSTIGIGTGYDVAILDALARGGSGNHSFAEHGDAAAAALAGELDGLLSKTAQAVSLLIEPTDAVTGLQLLTDLTAQPVEGGVLAELGDFYGGERRRVLLTADVPAMAALGLAQVARLTLRYVELPGLQEHTVMLPISVNVVPKDVADGRVPAPEVQQELLLLQTQHTKRRAVQALDSGDTGQAMRLLDEAKLGLSSGLEATMSPAMMAEAAWIDSTRDLLETRDVAYSSRRMRADVTRKSRGHSTRSQGGEVPGSNDDV